MSFGAYGEYVTVYVKMDVLLFKARQISFQFIAVALVLDISLELIKRAALKKAERRSKELLFEFIHITERIIKGIVFLSIRSHFKHIKASKISYHSICCFITVCLHIGIIFFFLFTSTIIPGILEISTVLQYNKHKVNCAFGTKEWQYG